MNSILTDFFSLAELRLKNGTHEGVCIVYPDTRRVTNNTSRPTDQFRRAANKSMSLTVRWVPHLPSVKTVQYVILTIQSDLYLTVCFLKFNVPNFKKKSYKRIG